MGILNIVGIGPGNDEHITPAAIEAIKSSDHVIGYTTYIRLIKKHIQGKEITRTGMSEEIGRARVAIEMAKEGKTISLVSSGDAGKYGMAGLVFDVLKEIGWKRGDQPEIRFLPGITAANSCGSLVGAPLVHDSCTISLSDLLTPWTVIENRIESAAKGDFVISFYNPASGRRQRQIVEAQKILKKHRLGTTPVALIKSAYRKRQEIILTDLDNFLDFEIGMLTTVMVGSSQTYVYEGYMVTPRGYSNKYDLAKGEIKPGQRKTFSLNHDGDMKSRLEDLKVLEGDNVQLAKTYITPTQNWVTPKDVNDTSILDGPSEIPELRPLKPVKKKESPEESALKALEFLKDTGLLSSRGGKTTQSVINELNTDQNVSTLCLLEGSLLFFDGEKYFQIGDFKNPCDLSEYGFSESEVYQPGKVKELKKISEGNQKTKAIIITEGKGVEAAFDLYQKYAITRNNSISKRIVRSVEENSSKVLYNGEVLTDARWLAGMPQALWENVREGLLKC